MWRILRPMPWGGTGTSGITAAAPSASSPWRCSRRGNVMATARVCLYTRRMSPATDAAAHPSKNQPASAFCPLPAKMHDIVHAAHRRPRNVLIPGSDHFMAVVEFVEVRPYRARQCVVRLARAGRVDMDGEILARRIPGKDERVVGEDSGQLDRIAVRPIERARDGALFLLERQFQSDVFHGERPGPCD